MCRFAAYLGPEIYISSLVTEPTHSLIHQSYQAKERIEPLNGDGFGIGWISMGKYSCREGETRMAEGQQGFLVVSEPLNDDRRWQKVENNHLVLVDAESNVTTEPIPTFA